MEGKRRALDKIASRQHAADENREENAERSSRLRRLLNRRWFNNVPAPNTGRRDGPTKSGDQEVGIGEVFMERVAIRHAPVNLWFLWRI
jgi:hypothetical protein